MLFFPDFSRKNNCSHAQILSKNCPFSKNTLLSGAYFVKKRKFSKKDSALISFFLICKYFETSCINTHIWCKNVNFVKTILYYGPKSQKDAFFFLPIFQGKIAALMPIFCQKIVQSLKNTVLSCHLLQIFIKNPRVMPIFS